MDDVEHGVQWWESLKARRLVCVCGDFYPCMRMRSQLGRERRDDEQWQTKYADELLDEFGQYGIGPSAKDRRREIESRLPW